MLGQWENAIEWFKNRNENIIDHLLLDKRKAQTTSRMFDLLDTTHKLTEKSIVLEIGCGMARNLREARRRYKCRVVGLDINKDFINMNGDFFKEYGKFEVADLSKDISALSKYDDNYFDLGISYAFLMCIAPGDHKAKLIREFLRICKCVYMYEYAHCSDRREDMYRENGEVITVWDDYRKYDDRIMQTSLLEDGHYRLYTHQNPT